MNTQLTPITVKVQLRTLDVFAANFIGAGTRPLILFAALVVVPAFVALFFGISDALATLLTVLVVIPVVLCINSLLSMKNPALREPIVHTFSNSGINSQFKGVP